jgi:hypothetical protein
MPVDMAEAFRTSIAAAFPESEPPSDTEPRVAAAPAPDDAEADGAALDGESAADDSAEASAPEMVSLTKAEVTLLRRQANDQKATAQRLADLQRDFAETRKQAESHQSAAEAKGLGFDALAQRAREAGNDALYAAILEEQRKTEWFAQQKIGQKTADEERAQVELAQLEGAKQAAARDVFKDTVANLVEMGSPLGIKRTEIEDLMKVALADDADAQDFLSDFEAARTPAEAEKAAKRLYRQIERTAKAAMQERKIKEITANDNDTPARAPRVRGTSGGGAADPYAHLPIGERGKARIAAAINRDNAALFPTV